MTAWIRDRWKACRQRPAVAVLAVALVAAVGEYTALGPVRAGVTSNTAPLDNSQVGALLQLDQAMEAVTARVTPAIVNVAVTSRAKSQPAGEGIPDDLQRFFGQQGMPQQQPRIERGI